MTSKPIIPIRARTRPTRPQCPPFAMSDPDGTPRRTSRWPALFVGLLVGLAAASCRTAPAPPPQLAPGTPVAWPDQVRLNQPVRGTLAAAINRGLRQNRVAVISSTPADASITLGLETLARDTGWLEVTWPADRPPSDPSDFQITASIGPFDDAADTGARLARSIRDRLDDLWEKGYAPIDRESPSAPRAGVPIR